MDRCAVRLPAVIGSAFLLFSTPGVARGASLREEAISYRTQGFEAQRRGDRATALTLYQKAAALDPEYPTPLNDTGVILEEQGRLEEAEQAYRQALSLNPNYLEAHANIAMLYERMGKREQAIFHWLKRYQLGDAHDPWTARAEERLVALDVLKTYPGMKGKIYHRRKILEDEFDAQERSLEEFHAITERRGAWPPPP